jgi:glycosyltransferase involved in cell wall biosynthesis
VGPDEDEDPLPEAVVRALRSDPRVVLTGNVPDTAPAYAAMDVVALPSYREGMPNVALEGAAMELPVVATRIPGCVDAVQDGVTGTLVPPHDAVALREALRRYLRSAPLRAEHGAAARRRVLVEFDQVAVWEAIASEYGRLVERSRSADLAAALPPP